MEAINYKRYLEVELCAISITKMFLQTILPPPPLRCHCPGRVLLLPRRENPTSVGAQAEERERHSWKVFYLHSFPIIFVLIMKMIVMMKSRERVQVEAIVHQDRLTLVSQASGNQHHHQHNHQHHMCLTSSCYSPSYH